MNLKTTPVVAIELCSYYSENELELCGCCALEQVNHTLKCAVQSKSLTSDNHFEKVFGFNNRFFYALEQLKDRQVLRYERGIGYIYQKDNKIILKREIPIATGDGSGPPIPCQGTCSYFNCIDCEHLVAYSTLPSSYGELLLQPNSLITNYDPFVPSALVVEKNSVVGRLEGEIKCLNSEELASILSNHTKQLSLKASRLDAKKIGTNCLELKPSNNKEVKKGSLIYDEAEDCLKFYNGTTWKRIVYEDT